jgi:acyl dehydratase
MADFGFAPAVVVEATIRAADGPLSVTSRSTMLLPDEPRTGRAVPRQPKVFGTERLGGLRLRLPVDLPARYADASGDHNPIHVDPAAAAAAGLPGVVVHGMCTMAVAWAAVDRAVAYPGPGRLARAATRFSRPVLPGEDLTLEVFRTSQERTLRADVAQRGHAVLKDLTFSLHSLEPA